MDMGYVDAGGGPALASTGAMAGMGHSGGRSVATLTDPSTGQADVQVTLVARKQTARLASGQEIEGYTLNGLTPGPEIDAVEGQLIEVRLVNESVPDGVVLHWHGVDVPGAEDGTAGVTQDAVRPGSDFVYRFHADHAGTYWYHSHQLAHEQVVGGLFGAMVIAPKGSGPRGAEALALVHLYNGRRTVDGREGDIPFEAAPGAPVRVRVINTDNGPMRVWVTGAGFRLLAVDGREVNGPTPLRDTGVQVTAGGRADLEVVAPPEGSGVRVELGGNAAMVLGAPIPTSQPPASSVDLLTYGTPAPLGFDPAAATRRFEYAIGRWPGIVDGVPGLWWTINGHLYPDVPMFLVREGDVVTMHISNSSGEVHPMHLHGHHAVVLSRNGVSATGSPWWFDSLNVENGDSYDIAFVADNPGIWMDHCHQLQHAAQGLVAHLAYEGITEPFLIGGTADNDPE
jgi:FtsP/CotA-like multicopper oxidase with cupredoxin domain